MVEKLWELARKNARYTQKNLLWSARDGWWVSSVCISRITNNLTVLLEQHLYDCMIIFGCMIVTMYFVVCARIM